MGVGFLRVNHGGLQGLLDAVGVYRCLGC